MDNKIKVLFIDDDMLLGATIHDALEEKGYEVEYLPSLMVAEEIVHKWGPDCIIIDIDINGKDGINAIPALHLGIHDVPVIVVSSHTECEERIRALENGAVSFVRKPLEIEEIAAYINRFCQQKMQNVIELSSLKLNLDTYMLYKGTEEIKTLSKQEYVLLNILYKGLNKRVSQESIKRELWKDANVDDHALYNLIIRLRKILNVDSTLSISNVKGGYILHVNQ